jgi:hypothetical protein
MFDNMQAQKIHRQKLLSDALCVMSHWSFHETDSARQSSTEFFKAVGFLAQYHRGILRLYINFVHDYRTGNGE